MDEHIIDSCSLLNLVTGWRGLTELQGLQRTWYICDAVLNEIEYTREYVPGDKPKVVPIDMSAFIQSGLLLPTRPESTQEIEDYVNFATEVDDGEAQALAIAKHRGYLLLTDDYKATKIAARADVVVRTVSTATILRDWAQLHPENEARLGEVVQRISMLAQFNPRKDSPDFAWWRGYLTL